LGRTQSEVTGVGYETTRIGLPYGDWDAATARFEATSVTDRARRQAWEQRRKIAMLQGQSRRALAYTDSLIADSWFAWAMHHFVIMEGVFGVGYDSVAAAKAVDLERLANEGARLTATSYAVMCTLGAWHAFTQDTESAREAQRFLEEQVRTFGRSPTCPTAIEAMLAVDSNDGGAAVERLDSLLSINVSDASFNLILARIREYQGDHGAALAAVRRNAYAGIAVNSQLAHPFMLREEGRLAAIVGDTAGAIRAYDHYLAIRTDPDPAVQPEVDEVRRALAELVGEGRR
jgi:hypothetical protein